LAAAAAVALVAPILQRLAVLAAVAAAAAVNLLRFFARQTLAPILLLRLRLAQVAQAVKAASRQLVAALLVRALAAVRQASALSLMVVAVVVEVRVLRAQLVAVVARVRREIIKAVLAPPAADPRLDMLAVAREMRPQVNFSRARQMAEMAQAQQAL
jgi:hypothetical protein